jgi:transcription elongation factor Elf1
MAVLKHFECIQCGSEGKITIKGTEVLFSDIVYCPVCGGDIFEEADFEEEE